MVDPEEFDSSMIFAMKTILSFYEVVKDRILSDYLYMLCIPLVVIINIINPLDSYYKINL